MGVKLFIELCPQEIVREHRDRLASLTASYREAKEEGEERSSPHLIEGPREVLGKSKGV
jgi:hypothetical protein